MYTETALDFVQLQISTLKVFLCKIGKWVLDWVQEASHMLLTDVRSLIDVLKYVLAITVCCELPFFPIIIINTGIPLCAPSLPQASDLLTNWHLLTFLQ